MSGYVAFYKDAKKPMVVRHVGYTNVKLSFQMARALVPSPDKAVLLGCSAGGIGALVHMGNFRKTFPDARKFVVSDAGVPFKPPHIYSSAYDELMNTWGVKKRLSELFSPASGTISDLGDIVRANTIQFPDTRFGLISSYHDAVMTAFGLMIGSPKGLRVVHDNIIDVADHGIGRNTANATAFFTETTSHCLTEQDMTKVWSLGTPLSSWLSDMVEDRPWANSRPDLFQKVQPDDLGPY